MRDARSSPRIASSTVTFGIVTAFLVLSSLAGLLGGTERPPGAALGSTLGASWSLRGTLVPPAEASPAR